MQKLIRGNTGALVEMLQLALGRSGYLSEAPDGIFGPRTQNALLRFQKSFGLPPTGEADEATWEYLLRYIRGYFTRTVQPGDTFWSLAAQYGASLNAMAAANPGVDPKTLQPGMRIAVPFGFPVVPENVSYCNKLIEEITAGLQARYPFLEVSYYGKSALGRDLPLLKVGNGPKTLFVNAGFHSNEWLNIPVLLTFLEDCLWALANGGRIEGENAETLFSSVTLYAAPVVNPDGLDIVTGALKTGAAFDKAVQIANDYPGVPFPDGWKANAEGVDLNLQFPAGWETAKSIKYAQGFTSPAPRDYVGPAPLAAPEARSIYEITNDIAPDLILAYHSQGNIIYWKYLDFLPPESLRIGGILSAAGGYPLVFTPEDAAYAGYKDWFIQQYNKPGYTIETGSGTNPLPLSQFDAIYAANAPLLAAALRETARL